MCKKWASKGGSMEEKRIIGFIADVLQHMPTDWLKLTTHRLDIYEERLAKTQFLDRLESLYDANDANTSALRQLPTAYDYIRLGHPLSCFLEWVIAKKANCTATSVISFSSKTMAVLAILRTNALTGKSTRIIYNHDVPIELDVATLRTVYNYNFELVRVDRLESIDAFDGSTILISKPTDISNFNLVSEVDFYVNIDDRLGSIVLATGDHKESYISAIQHVRRRESIAMTPANCLIALQSFLGKSSVDQSVDITSSKTQVVSSINKVVGTFTKVLLGNCGLSIQYAIMMGLVDDALENHPGKEIKFVVPPNCYGGTNDQARRVAACLENVSIVDLPVDGANDMVQSIDRVLSELAAQDAVPYIIAEIPTNPRVEVPDLIKLQEVLSKKRKTSDGVNAIAPVFILDQTFCPNVHFLGEGAILSSVKTIAYVSGSKFPSGGLCTAGYCAGNQLTEVLMQKVDKHLQLCDNEATALQVGVLAKQMPTMISRIDQAYKNTRDFVKHIKTVLPSSKINFVSEELASAGFTPSVFSLIPDDSKFCVSYGQLKGSYWTIPATSTQGTTKEGDKDYIVRVSCAPRMDVELHKRVFSSFVENL